jgi:hypothetical protein
MKLTLLTGNAATKWKMYSIYGGVYRLFLTEKHEQRVEKEKDELQNAISIIALKTSNLLPFHSLSTIFSSIFFLQFT